MHHTSCRRNEDVALHQSGVQRRRQLYWIGSNGPHHCGGGQRGRRRHRHCLDVGRSRETTSRYMRHKHICTLYSINQLCASTNTIILVARVLYKLSINCLVSDNSEAELLYRRSPAIALPV